MNREEGRSIGLISMILLGINGIIGSGIFLLPGQVMGLVGNWSIAVYLFVTFLVLSIAWCFAQCAALFNRSGGAYVYAKEAFGHFIGFEVGIMRWAVAILAWAAMVVGFVTALSSIWPEALAEPNRSIIILSLIGSLGLINITGVQAFKHLNNVVTIAKLFPLLIFVLLGVFFLKEQHFTLLVLEELEFSAFGSASLMIFYAFGGFENLVVAAGEMKNPKKNLPIAVMIVISFCSILYFLIQMVAIGLLGDALANSVTPIADSAHLILGDWGKLVVTLAMLISIGGINVAASFVTPRNGVALAEDGMVPRWIGSKGRFGTPVWAILLTVGLTALIALSGSFAQLITISVVSRFVQYTSTCLAVYVLHRKQSSEYTRLKRLFLIAIPTIALIGLGWLLMQATIIQLAWGLGGLILGLPLYWLQQRSTQEEATSNIQSRA